MRLNPRMGPARRRLTAATAALLASSLAPAQDEGAPESAEPRPAAGENDPDGSTDAPVGERFFSRGRTWSMELPEGWRQMSPAEAHRLRRTLHPDMLDPQPLRRYAIGRVDRWLGDGGFDGVVVVVEEHADELIHDESLPELIRDHWREQNAKGEIRHDIDATTAVEFGKERYAALEVRRRITFPDAPAVECLDLYVPTDGKELMFSFRAPPETFDEWQAEYRRWLATASFARPSRGQPSLAQRLFWPLVLGGGVALAMIFAHRASRQAMAREAAGGVRA